MGMEATGKIHALFETKQVSARFSKREFVVELADNPRYPQVVMFQATGDRCDQLDDFNIGDEVRVEFSLRGREWRPPSGEVKYFNTLDVWKVEHVGQRTAPGSSRSRPPPSAGGGSPPPSTDAPPPISDDDIPF